jgi:hypothetical protein
MVEGGGNALRAGGGDKDEVCGQLRVGVGGVQEQERDSSDSGSRRHRYERAGRGGGADLGR